MIVMNMIGSEPIAKLVIFRLIQPMASNLISPQRLEAPSRGGNCWRHVEDYCCFLLTLRRKAASTATVSAPFTSKKIPHFRTYVT